MARVTTDDVLAIMDTSETNVDIQIDMANNFVDEVLSSNENMTEDRLTNIEIFIAAHFVYMKTPQRKSEKLGDAADQYHVGKLGEGLNASPYGQQALLLDTSGRLAQLGKQKATFKAIDLEL